MDEDLLEFEKEGKLCYFPVVQNPDENWAMGQGRITAKMIQSFMPEPKSDNDDSLIIVCGPQALKDEVTAIIDQELGWKNCFVFN